MKVKFQTWIENNHLPANANHLLNTAVVCYKADANTAALLMSYLGFLVILKDRIMKANKPNPFPQATWDSLIHRLQNEDKWEEAVFDSAMQQEKIDSTRNRIQAPIFVINENLRTQIRYWKDRRNDCAHNKDNAIMASHVDAFWSFLESNMQKITVEGGKATLLNKIKRHYDPSYTPSGEDVSPLVKEIKSSVEKSELNEFWKEGFSAINGLFDYSDEIDFTYATLRLSDAEITDSLIMYLKGNYSLLISYLEKYPSLISHLGYTKQEIHNFWNTKLVKSRNPLGIYSAMIRSGLIKGPEIAAANQILSSIKFYNPTEEDHSILEKNGFGEILYQRLFVTNSQSDLKYWHFMNNHYELYTNYVEMYPLKDNVVQVLCIELSKTDWVAKFLQGSLNNLFISNPSKKKEFKDIAIRLGVALPTNIPELHI